MEEKIREFEHKALWKYFLEILKIPRPSKKEEKIRAYLLDFGKEHNLETIVDEIGNVLIRKPATSGMEKRKSVVLQSHIDMVCEKNEDVDFDFDKDAIIPRIEGEWVKATGTTLGADDGIGMAAQLAILAADNIPHGPIECLFTVDEETGLTGAFGLKPNFLQSKILLNLDSEDDGELFIGCAGGKDTLIKLPKKTQTADKSKTAYSIEVKGLKGGHSGDEIQKGLGNAVKIMNRLLWEADRDFNIQLAKLDAGNLRNAIAREAFATILIDKNKQEAFENYIQEYAVLAKKEIYVSDPDLLISAEKKSADTITEVLDAATQKQLLNAIYACPHGVIAWSQDIANFVETSTNLASIKFKEDHILITTSQRSSVDSAKDNICQMVASVFHLTDAKVEHSDGYPGWTPNPDSEIMKILSQSYEQLFNQKPKVLAIHAGLECGLIGEKYPGMDMISYGPTIKGAHSPDERLKIDTVSKFWDVTLDVLKKIPEKE
jgi:dipeptidase D